MLSKAASIAISIPIARRQTGTRREMFIKRDTCPNPISHQSFVQAPVFCGCPQWDQHLCRIFLRTAQVSTMLQTSMTSTTDCSYVSQSHHMMQRRQSWWFTIWADAHPDGEILVISIDSPLSYWSLAQMEHLEISILCNHLQRTRCLCINT